MLTQEELRQIQRLHIQAGRAVDSPFAGGYRSAFRGRGMEFEEVRPYVPGDDIRHIDWNVTARSDIPFVKVFREERELTLLLIVDVSSSMRFGEGGKDGLTDKRRQMARIAGALAFAGVKNQDKIGLLTFSDKVEHYMPPRRSQGHAWAVIQKVFEDHGPQRETRLDLALQHAARVLKRRSVICLISDFLPNHNAAAAHNELRFLSWRHTVHGFVLHAPAEEHLPNVGLLEIEDAETGQRRLIDTATLSHMLPVTERLQQLRKAGLRTSAISTEEDPFSALSRHFSRFG